MQRESGCDDRIGQDFTAIQQSNPSNVHRHSRFPQKYTILRTIHHSRGRQTRVNGTEHTGKRT
jgi:hypothetical protein